MTIIEFKKVSDELHKLWLSEGSENAHNKLEPMSDEESRYHRLIGNWLSRTDQPKYYLEWSKAKLHVILNPEEIIEKLKLGQPLSQEEHNLYKVGYMMSGTHDIYLPRDLLQMGFDPGFAKTDGERKYYAQLMATVAKHELLHYILLHAAEEAIYLKTRGLSGLETALHDLMNWAADLHLSRFYTNNDKKVQRHMKLYATMVSGLILEDFYAQKREKMEWDDVTYRKLPKGPGLLEWNISYWKSLLNLTPEEALERLGGMLYEEIADRLLVHVEIPEDPPQITGYLKDPTTFVGDDGTIYGE